ncbi:MAG TPA: TIGR03435 family protein [Acidobacteriaceae bacterium]|jgi:uncharacterized protein (TIGR03435 family)|nr:TIGR03435 family protein [Acidobacteriaceae bacterium]
MLQTSLTLLFTCSLALASPPTHSQTGSASTDLPAFEVASIKPPEPGADRIMGFNGKPGGRVFFGGTVRMLVFYAFNVQRYQIVGGGGLIDSQWFCINAVPPADSPSRDIKLANADPTPEQRLMLQSLLRDRFGFRFHFETKQGEVYILTRSNKPLKLTPPKDPAEDPRAIVILRPGGIADGEAIGTNTTIDYFARSLSFYLGIPVLNETDLAGSYDFYLPADDPENHDLISATLGVVSRLGFRINRGRGPINSVVIDHLEQPSPN